MLVRGGSRRADRLLDLAAAKPDGRMIHQLEIAALLLLMRPGPM